MVPSRLRPSHLHGHSPARPTSPNRRSDPPRPIHRGTSAPLAARTDECGRPARRQLRERGARSGSHCPGTQLHQESSETHPQTYC